MRDNAQIDNNKVINTGAEASGGGMRLDPSGELHMHDNASVHNNTVEGGSGGGIHVRNVNINMHNDVSIHSNTAVNGGGIHMTGGGNLNLHSGTINRNTATTGHGGGINNEVVANAGTLVLGDGIHIFGNTAGGNGGGIRTHRTLTISGTAVIGYNAGTPVFDENGVLIPAAGQANTAGGNGGGVHIGGSAHPADFTLTGATIRGNAADGNGGGVFATGTGTFTIGGTTQVRGNRAASGGGIYSTRNLTITGTGTGVLIQSNEATGNGGGIFMSGNTSVLSVTGSTIGGATVVLGNEAGGHGGGIFMSGTVTAANLNTMRARLTTSADTTFRNNRADDEERIPILIGTANFPDINWQGQNSLLGVRGATPAQHVNPHLLNDYDVFWDHPFGVVELELVIVGHQWGTATATSDDNGTPVSITANSATSVTKDVTPSGQVTITAALLAQFLPPATINNHSGRFNITVTKDDGTGTAVTLFTTAALSTFPSSGVTFNMPDTDTTVSVTIAPAGGLNLTPSTDALDLNYGTHPITVLSRTIPLGYNLLVNGGTDPADAQFEVFNPALGNWRLTVESSQGASGCSVLYTLMRVGASDISQASADIYNFTASSPAVSAELIYSFDWNDLNHNGIEIAVPAGGIAVGVGTPRTAVIAWSLIVGP